MRLLQSFLRDTQGATAVEYGLVLGLICMVMIVAFGTLTNTLTDLFGLIQSKLDTPVP
ncbi:Flp family type IVb pilin [Neorhizobium lilium]|uniref:Flp family type IVb pilin n=1 Tax=Neorhizobium lilium TaxID=2503024 RepID=A0A444L9Z4_9HYPH|nr:Flp family type IVb pilin [Neorhizobium lilium]RWX74365.1 Flp family type IVb pilin [Neorhizobium lilium]